MVLAPKLYQFLVGVFASMGSILFGYDLGVIAEVYVSKYPQIILCSDPNAALHPNPSLLSSTILLALKREQLPNNEQ